MTSTAAVVGGAIAFLAVGPVPSRCSGVPRGSRREGLSQPPRATPGGLEFEPLSRGSCSPELPRRRIAALLGVSSITPSYPELPRGTVEYPPAPLYEGRGYSTRVNGGTARALRRRPNARQGSEKNGSNLLTRPPIPDLSGTSSACSPPTAPSATDARFAKNPTRAPSGGVAVRSWRSSGVQARGLGEGNLGTERGHRGWV